MSFKTIHSELIYQGRVFNVRRDKVQLPNGKEATLDIVEHNDAVTLIPLDEEGKIWFVRQYRHPAEEEILELPAGLVEEGEPAETSALREIREEIGMAAGKIEKLGVFYLAPGYSAEFMHVFLATELQPEALEADEDEFLSVEKYSIEDAYALAASGKIRDAKTLAALFLARPFISM
jgi:ADP-ribose pyrophosphatase